MSKASKMNDIHFSTKELSFLIALFLTGFFAAFSMVTYFFYELDNAFFRIMYSPLAMVREVWDELARILALYFNFSLPVAFSVVFFYALFISYYLCLFMLVWKIIHWLLQKLLKR